MYLRLITPAVVAVLLVSCSSKPEILEIEQELKREISQESDGRIELVSVEKTNAEEKEYFGQKVYTIYYKANIKFKENCYMYVNKSGVGPFFESFKTYTEEPEFIPSFQMQAVECPKGKSVDYESSCSYKNTEEGWVLTK